VRSPGGETAGVEDWPMVASPDGLDSSGPSGQGKRDGGKMRQRSGHILGQSGVTKVSMSIRRCSFACFRGHRPASGGVGVGADTTPADPDGERGVVHNREGERERAAAARPKCTCEWPGSQPQQCDEGGAPRDTRRQSWPTALRGDHEW
jgi:hypothetical protein